MRVFDDIFITEQPLIINYTRSYKLLPEKIDIKS